jgi:Fur family ferric uptake transcriptional regulator
VLAALAQAERALTHAEIEARLGDLAGDRVTLYRVLDWLVQSGLAHKVTDEARVFRFSVAAGQAQHGQHGHFRCDDCGRVYCLERVQPARPRVPQGFRVAQVEMSVRGKCANCTGARR